MIGRRRATGVNIRLAMRPKSGRKMECAYADARSRPTYHAAHFFHFFIIPFFTSHNKNAARYQLGNRSDL